MTRKKSFFKIGGSLRVRFPWAQDIYRIHIVAIVENEMIVYRYYGKHKQWWHYGIEHWGSIRFYYEQTKK